ATTPFSAFGSASVSNTYSSFPLPLSASPSDRPTSPTSTDASAVTPPFTTTTKIVPPTATATDCRSGLRAADLPAATLPGGATFTGTNSPSIFLLDSSQACTAPAV